MLSAIYNSIYNGIYLIIHVAAIQNQPSSSITVDTVSNLSTSDITVYLILSAEYEEIGITVFFDINIHPPVHMSVYNSTKVIQLTLLYNTVYNVSIESLTNLCGQTGASTQIELKYSEYNIYCGAKLI